MDGFKHVLIAIDFSSGSAPALALAAGMVRAGGAELTLLHVHALGFSLELPAARAPLDNESRARSLRALERLAYPWRDRVGGVNLVVREGDPATEITAFAEAHGVDLIALGTHGRRGMDRLILGSVAEHVSRLSHCSVLAVHQPPSGSVLGSSGGLQGILCALDLAESSEVTLGCALALAETTAARVTVMHAIDAWHWKDPWPMARVSDEEARRLLSESARERLSRVLAENPEASVIETVITFGRPATEILRVARQGGADAIVLGVHSRAGMDRFFFGSTAQAVLRGGAGAVLLVRSPAAPRKAVVEPKHEHVEVQKGDVEAGALTARRRPGGPRPGSAQCGRRKSTADTPRAAWRSPARARAFGPAGRLI
jgi:nucleotide-binding universal stress UspA family protein